MKPNKSSIYSQNSYFWIPTYYDMDNDIYFCEPESKEFISSFYQKEYWDNFWSKRLVTNILYKMAIWIVKIPDLLNYRNFQVLKRLGYLNKNPKILEIWIWEWKNLTYLKKLWYNILWVEMDPENVKKINTLFNKEVVFQGNYEDIKLEWKYDIIYMRHVLEHFLDLEYVINNLKNNLNEWWIVFIDVPFCESDYTLKWSIFEHPHIYHFTKKSLNNLFEEGNFQNIYMEYYVRRNLNISRFNFINKIYVFILMMLKLPSYKTGGNVQENGIYDLIWIFKLKETWKK